MNSSHEAAPADLCEILDALEAGLLRLRQERDRLRETLTKAKKVTPKKKAKTKARKKAAPVKPQPPAEPKAPPKPRAALGRTLTQIRAKQPPQS